jgi:hypothetical protein
MVPPIRGLIATFGSVQSGDSGGGGSGSGRAASRAIRSASTTCAPAPGVDEGRALPQALE